MWPSLAENEQYEFNAVTNVLGLCLHGSRSLAPLHGHVTSLGFLSFVSGFKPSLAIIEGWQVKKG